MNYLMLQKYQGQKLDSCRSVGVAPPSTRGRCGEVGGESRKVNHFGVELTVSWLRSGRGTTYSSFNPLLASSRLPDPLLGAPDPLTPRALGWAGGVETPLTIQGVDLRKEYSLVKGSGSPELHFLRVQVVTLICHSLIRSWRYRVHRSVSTIRKDGCGCWLAQIRAVKVWGGIRRKQRNQWSLRSPKPTLGHKYFLCQVISNFWQSLRNKASLALERSTLWIWIPIRDWGPGSLSVTDLP